MGVSTTAALSQRLERMSSDVSVMDMSAPLKAMQSVSQPVSVYQSNLTWGEDKGNSDLYTKNMLDYKVFALENNTAQDDRQRVQTTTNQETVQTHKGTEAGYLRTHKLGILTDAVYGSTVWEASESVLDRAAEVTLTETSIDEKTLTEQEKLDGKTELKRLEHNLDIWKINSEWMEIIGEDIQAWSVAANVPMFWNPTTGENSTTNPW
jgi:hypothetical protein